jgi:hypothetical protein
MNPVDTDGRRETLARIIVNHNLDTQYREFGHAIAFFDCCETPGGSYQNLSENHKIHSAMVDQRHPKSYAAPSFVRQALFNPCDH